MCLLLYELLNIFLVLCIVHIARYALRIGKCTCYFTCANLKLMLHVALNVLVSIWALYLFSTIKMFHLLSMCLFMLYVQCIHSCSMHLSACEFGEIGRSEAA